MAKSARLPRARTDRRRLGLAQLLIVILIVGTAGGVGALLYRDARNSQPVVPIATVGTATRGGEYVEGAIGFPSHLNPLLAASQSEKDLSAILFRGLTRIDGSGLPQPDLADKWAVSDDGLTYRFTLRPGIQWHDGSPLTSQDVRFTTTLVQDADFPGDTSLSRFWRAVVVDTPSPEEVVFHLLEPFAAFPNYASLPIVPRHLLGGTLARDLPSASFDDAPVGSGPYRLDRVDRDSQSISLLPFAGYDGEQPFLNSIRLRYFSDTEALMTAVRSKAVDGTGAVAASALQRPGALPSDEKVYAPVMSSFTALFFNLRGELFSSVDIRRAVSLGFDRQGIVDTILRDQAVVAAGPIPSPSWAYSEQPVQYDPAQATEILLSAGWSDSDGDGILDNGTSQFSFPLLVNADDPQRVAVASEIAQQLARIKIQVQVQPLSTAEVSQALATRQFVAAVFGWHSPTGDPDGYQLWHSSQAEDGLNFVGLRDQSIDKVLEDARSTTDLERRRSLYAEFQAQFARSVPAVILYYPRYYFALDAGFQGVRADPIINPSDRLRGISTWFSLAARPESTDTPRP